jgi:deazaflavin-dependent oxidoreductase (nitroreductase family)
MDMPVIRISKGRRSITSPATGVPVVTLTTRGARTGKLRTTPLGGFPDGDKIVLIGTNWGRQHHAEWYYNLRANPEVTLSMKGSTGIYVAREATGEEREAYWQMAVDFYRGYESYRQRIHGRQIPIMVLTPKKP